MSAMATKGSGPLPAGPLWVGEEGAGRDSADTSLSEQGGEQQPWHLGGGGRQKCRPLAPRVRLWAPTGPRGVCRPLAPCCPTSETL